MPWVVSFHKWVNSWLTRKFWNNQFHSNDVFLKPSTIEYALKYPFFASYQLAAFHDESPKFLAIYSRGSFLRGLSLVSRKTTGRRQQGLAVVTAVALFRTVVSC